MVVKAYMGHNLCPHESISIRPCISVLNDIVSTSSPDVSDHDRVRLGRHNHSARDSKCTRCMYGSKTGIAAARAEDVWCGASGAWGEFCQTAEDIMA